MGADFIEPDLVSTHDGVLVARHENEIGGTSDVADRPEFADRRATKAIDGVELTGWFTEDFTLDELKTLRAVERLPDLRPANTSFDGRFEIASLDEILTLLASNNSGREQPVGLCAEIKHSTYFSSVGLSIEPALLASLSDLDATRSHVIIESMETANLRALAQQTDVPLVQLMMDTGRPYDFTAAGDAREYADLTTPEALRDIATYAQGIGPNKKQVIPRDQSGRSLDPTPLVREAHAAGLFVVVWTLRDENSFLPAELRRGGTGSDKGDSVAEYDHYFDAGVDGVFSDHPHTAVAARRDWLGRGGVGG